MDDEREYLPPLPEATAAFGILQQVAPGLVDYMSVPGWAVPTLDLWRAAKGITQTAQIQVKEKLSTARVSVWTDAETTDAVRQHLSTLADDAEHRLEQVCLWCGRPGQPYKDRLYTIACPGCWDLLIAGWERRRPPEEQITIAQVDELTRAALADAEYRHERVSIQLCAAVARRLVTDPEPVLRVAEQNLFARYDHTSGLATDFLDEWANLLGGGHVAQIVRTMLAPDFKGYELRKAAPFAGVLTEEERLAAIASASAPTA